MEEFVQDLTTEINNLKQKNPYVSCTLDFIEQHRYTITTNLAAQLATSYLAENDTLRHGSCLILSTAGLRAIESTMQEEYDALPYETQIHRSEYSPFLTRATFVASGLCSMFYTNDIPSLTSFWFTFGLSLSTRNSNRMISEISGIISDMILLNSIYSFTHNYCTACNEYTP